MSSPPDIPWQLAQAWPDARLMLVHEAGHGAREPGMGELLRAAIDGFAYRR